MAKDDLRPLTRVSLHQFLVIGGGVFLTAVFLYCVPKPYIYIFVLWGIACLYVAALSCQPWSKAVWFNSGVVVLALGGTEIYFDRVYFDEEPLRETVFTADDADRGNITLVDLFGKNDVLGWAPTKGRAFFETTSFANQLLYKVKYTIDRHGLRIAPHSLSMSRDEARCLLFFGDSFTFGEGVQDEETMPYKVGLKTHGDYHVFNFGFLGYGPHQMLAQLQQGLVASAIDCRPAYAFYLALPDHVSRAAGLEAWDQFGPRFVVENGTVRWKGRFDSETPRSLQGQFRRLHQTLPYGLKRYLERSALYQGLLFMHRPVNDQDIDLFLRIVDLSRQTVESQYPGAQFNVILWDFSSGEEPLEATLISGLQAKGLTIHPISRILPDYHDHEARFELHPADGHPNQLAHELLADYIVNSVIASPPLK